MKKILLTLTILFSSSVAFAVPEYVANTTKRNLDDCTFNYVHAAERPSSAMFSVRDSAYLWVVRCPNSTTATTQYIPKQSPRTAVVIDGVTYIKK